MEENTNQELEKLEKNSSSEHGGAREGAGRRKGKVSETRKYQLAKFNEIKGRIARAANGIVNAQLGMARGTSYLFHTKWTTDKSGKLVKSTERVTDPDVIKQYLEGEFDDLQDEFYYITTKAPNNFALDSLLNRAFGKPKETVEVHDKSPRRQIIVNVVDPRNGTGSTQSPSNDSVSADVGSPQGPESQDNP